MIAGAPEGWRSTLDKLEAEVIHMTGGSGTEVRSVVHAAFHLERTYDAPAARVWRALTDETAKQKWFGGSPGQWELIERRMDVRVGGSERVKGRWGAGVVSTFDAHYHDVVANERLVYSYEMAFEREEDLGVPGDHAVEGDGCAHHPDGHRTGRVSRWLRRRRFAGGGQRTSSRSAGGLARRLTDPRTLQSAYSTSRQAGDRGALQPCFQRRRRLRPGRSWRQPRRPSNCMATTPTATRRWSSGSPPGLLRRPSVWSPCPAAPSPTIWPSRSSSRRARRR